MHNLIVKFEKQRHPVRLSGSRASRHQSQRSSSLHAKYVALLDRIQNDSFHGQSRFSTKNLLRKHCLHHHLPQLQRSPAALLARHLLHFDIFQEIQASPYDAKSAGCHRDLDYRPGHCPWCLEGILTAVDTENPKTLRAVLRSGFSVATKLQSSPEDGFVCMGKGAWKDGFNWAKVVPLWDMDFGLCVFVKLALLRDSLAKREMMLMVARAVCARGNAVGREFRFAVIKNLVLFRRKCIEEALDKAKVDGSLFFRGLSRAQITSKYSLSNIPSPDELITLLFDTIPLPKKQYNHLAERLWRVFFDLLLSCAPMAIQLFLTNPHLNQLIKTGAALTAYSGFPKAMLLPGPSVSVSTWLNTSIGYFYVAEAVLTQHVTKRILHRLCDLRRLAGFSYEHWTAYLSFCIRAIQEHGFDLRLNDTPLGMQQVALLSRTGKWYYLTAIVKELIKISGYVSYGQQIASLFTLSPARISLDVGCQGGIPVMIKKPWKRYVLECAEVLQFLRILNNVPVDKLIRMVQDNGNAGEFLGRFGKYGKYFQKVLAYEVTLQDLARCSIRQCIGSAHFVRDVQALKIPEKFQSFIIGDVLSFRRPCAKRTPENVHSVGNWSGVTGLGGSGKVEGMPLPMDDSTIWLDKPQRPPGRGVLSWAMKVYSPEMVVLHDLMQAKT
ncbi:uncharacterized protein LOC129601604 [Paramacrobiotus metropolitanus]|uniref:uncharacterized protein LOC129601604 n=1 Tax=Paramacrobiotus metropolitanus TaxID=2943436 RepID=UPI0024459987|nr:uncharacterized protein LOC129601604 [Paramacrobiotus metropolitanus]